MLIARLLLEAASTSPGPAAAALPPLVAATAEINPDAAEADNGPAA
jgi:hypothetical protein